MFTRLGTVVCTFAMVAVAPLTAIAGEPINDLADKANQKVVKLFGAGGFSRLNNFGSGVIISQEGHVLTVASQLLDTTDLVVKN
jgi:hypothetical protein